MAIVAGFDVHRAQITFDALNQETGEVYRGRIQHSGRFRLRQMRASTSAAVALAREDEE
jgi:hypothetical protein